MGYSYSNSNVLYFILNYVLTAELKVDIRECLNRISHNHSQKHTLCFSHLSVLHSYHPIFPK